MTERTWWRRVLWAPVERNETAAQTLVRAGGNLIRLGIYAGAALVLCWCVLLVDAKIDSRQRVAALRTLEVATGLAGYRLGVGIAEAKLLYGRPAAETDDSCDDGDCLKIWQFQDSYGGSNFLIFSRGDEEATLERICTREVGHKLSGIGVTSPRAEVLDRFGEPSHRVVLDDGYGVALDFADYQVGVEIEKGRVVMLCASSGRVVRDPPDDEPASSEG